MSHKRKAVLVLNPNARGGTAASRFEALRAHLEKSLDLQVLETDATGDWTLRLSSALQAGDRFVVVAGGDGTANHVITTIMQSGVPLNEITLGAVALGSSNDLHKPVAARLAGIPVRLDETRKFVRDVGRIQFWDGQGRRRRRGFLVSGSVGVTAQANAFFNQGDWILRFLKKTWTNLAVCYAALRTIWSHKAPEVLICVGGQEMHRRIANLSILKTPYLAGAFKFDTPVEPASGRFAINLCPNDSRLSLLVVMINLLFGRFLQLQGVSHWATGSLELSSDSPIQIEVDGEIVVTTRAVFDILPERIWLCR